MTVQMRSATEAGSNRRKRYIINQEKNEGNEDVFSLTAPAFKKHTHKTTGRLTKQTHGLRGDQFYNRVNRKKIESEANVYLLDMNNIDPKGYRYELPLELNELTVYIASLNSFSIPMLNLTLSW